MRETIQLIKGAKLGMCAWKIFFSPPSLYYIQYQEIWVKLLQLFFQVNLFGNVFSSLVFVCMEIVVVRTYYKNEYTQLDFVVSYSSLHYQQIQFLTVKILI